MEQSTKDRIAAVRVEKSRTDKSFVVKIAGQIGLGLAIGVIGFQAGRDTEHVNGTEVKAYNPLTWVASPLASAAEELHIVSTPTNNR